MLDKLLGNQKEIDQKSALKELGPIIVQGEKFHSAYAVFRDMLVFTDKRFIFIDKQGVSGKKMSITSVPYKSIKMFSIETAGTLDRDSELKIWLSGSTTPLAYQFQKGDLIFKVQEALVIHM